MSIRMLLVRQHQAKIVLEARSFSHELPFRGITCALAAHATSREPSRSFSTSHVPPTSSSSLGHAKVAGHHH